MAKAIHPAGAGAIAPALRFIFFHGANMSVDVFLPPAVEPVTLAEAKQHCRVTASDDDAYISNLIMVARQRAEVYLSRAIVTQTLELWLDCFQDEIFLPRAPVQSIEFIKYLDVDGVEQTLDPSTYQARVSGTVAHSVKPAAGGVWPATLDFAYDAVTIRYVAGYGLPTDSPNRIPHPISQAILVAVAEMFENREEAVIGQSVIKLPNTSHNLLAPYRQINL